MTVTRSLPSSHAGTTDPSTIPNLVAWWKASDAVGVTHTPPSVGEAVSSLPGHGGLGPTMTQATSTKRPTYQTDFNGRPCLRFDGVDDFMTVTTGVMAVADKTIFAVWRNTDADVVGNQAIIAWNSSSGHLAVSASEQVRLVYQSTTPATVSLSATPVDFTAAGVRNIYSARLTTSGGSCDRLLRRNGSTRLSSSATPGASTSSTTMQLASANGTTLFLKGDIAEALCYARSLTTAEMQSAARYLAALYGITVA